MIRRPTAGVEGMIRRRAAGVYAAMVLAFLHLPLLILIAFSFNANRFTVWTVFAAVVSGGDGGFAVGGIAGKLVIIALVAAGLSTVIGTLAAWGMWRNKCALAVRDALSVSGDAGDCDGNRAAGFVSGAFRFLHLPLGMHTVILRTWLFQLPMSRSWFRRGCGIMIARWRKRAMDLERRSGVLF